MWCAFVRAYKFQLKVCRVHWIWPTIYFVCVCFCGHSRPRMRWSQTLTPCQKSSFSFGCSALCAFESSKTAESLTVHRGRMREYACVKAKLKPIQMESNANLLRWFLLCSEEEEEEERKKNRIIFHLVQVGFWSTSFRIANPLWLPFFVAVCFFATAAAAPKKHKNTHRHSYSSINKKCVSYRDVPCSFFSPCMSHCLLVTHFLNDIHCKASKKKWLVIDR